MRLFIAANIPEDLKDKFAILTKRLKYKISGIRWVRDSNFHLTLKFLGEVKEERIEKISKALSNAAEGISPFNVHFLGLGAFPNEHSPRIVWAGIKEGTDELKKLADRIEYFFAGIGFEKEKRAFSAHLTLGRSKTYDLKEISFENLDSDLGSYKLERIYLMQSTLTPEGPEYEILRSFELGGKSS